MDLLQALKTATMALQAGGFSGAARQLGVNPAAVSKQIAQLEAHLGTRLFDRSTRHFSATEEGRKLLERIDPSLRDIEAALSTGANARDERGIVKVSVPSAFARMALLPGLPEFQRRHPQVQVDLRLENRRIDLLAERYDCAIGTALAADSTLVSRTLITLRPVLCASPGYLAERGVPSRIGDLGGHRLIGHRSDTTGLLRDWELSWRGRPVKVKPEGGLVLTDPESAASAAVAGCGIALVGIHHIAAELIDGRLLHVLPQVQAQSFQIVVYYARRRLLPARTRAFVDHVLQAVPATMALRDCHEAMVLTKA